jgi:hypothetical protein
MVRYPCEHARFAGSAYAFGAGIVCGDSGIEDRIENRLAGFDRNSAVAACELDLKSAVDCRRLLGLEIYST